ncbi:hypothetical protein ABMA28_012799 [Loxostege sticticalis]|uniref:Uncharacterized protein n=1 Tax=Loxostege sticticalis TaxID=481309 RepID=A0ABD0S357_LOXSC
MLAVLLLNRMRARRQVLRKYRPKNTRKQEEIQVSEKLVEYCRTCLGNNDLVDIFYSEETAKKRSEDLKIVTGLEIQLNDGLSQKMCTKCIETLNLALQFIIISVKNDQKLRKLFKISNDNFETDTQEAQFLEEHEIGDNNNVDDLNFTVESNYEGKQNIENIEDFVDQNYLQMDTALTVNEKQPLQAESINKSAAVYQCHICDKEYNRKQTLRAHLRYHKNSIVCEECGKSCHSKSVLLEHKRAVHDLPRIHLCSYCDYSSATKAGLVVHERRHTGEREFVCSFCGARFHSRAGLVQHLPIHSEESNFECNICHKREKSKRLLQHHYHKVHREKRLRYLCPVCKEVFKSIGGTRKHLIKTHGVARCDQPAIQRFKISVPDTPTQETEARSRKQPKFIIY